MIVKTHSYGEMAENLTRYLRDYETQFWMAEAKRMREQLEAMAQAAIKGEAILIMHQGKQVKLLPENTALRMTGDIP